MSRNFAASPRCAAMANVVGAPIRRNHSRTGFTLVELLVVIAIIGVLAAMTVGVAVRVRTHVKEAAITMELHQLEMACQAYKEKFGEYPPDFSGLRQSTDSDYNAVIQDAAKKTILLHLAKAFPRYPNANNWNGFVSDLQAGWRLQNPADYSSNGFNFHLLSSMSALQFWLGGQPDWLRRTVTDSDGAAGSYILPGHSLFDPLNPVKGFLGFSANPSNPFESADSSPSRIKPFFDFNASSIRYYTAAGPGGLMIWPTNACDKETSPIVYFRNNNATYFQEGTPIGSGLPWVKSCGLVFAAVDTRTSSFGDVRGISWINSQSFQIFASGLDMTYGSLSTNVPMGPPSSTPIISGNYLAFPAGTNYAPATMDDITNFSGGKLESAIP